MFIVFEGVDKVGKSTAIENVAEKLRGCGRSVIVIHESNDPMMQYLKQSKVDIHTIAYLVNRMREEHQHLIKRILDAGHTLLMDRYYDSTYVYANPAIADNKYNEVRLFDHIAPDLTLYLYADSDLIVQRIAGETDRFTSDSKERVEKYLALFNQLYDGLTTRDVYDYDVTHKSIPEVAEECFRDIANVMRNSGL